MSYRDGITLRKDGNYMARCTITLNDGTKIRPCFYGKSKTIVKEKRNKAILDAANGTYVNTSAVSVKEYLLTWINRTTGIKDATRHKYLGELNKHVMPRIGSRKMSSLYPRDIQYMMDDILVNGNQVRTTQIIKNILSKAFREAAMDNLIKPDIMKNVRLEPYHPKEREIWNTQQVEEFLRCAQDDKYYIFFLLYVIYGLRRGEAIAIQIEDIDLENDIIHIRKQYTDIGGSYGITKLKTANSTRDLPILPEIRAIIMKTSEGKDAKTYLIQDDKGNPIKPTSINYHFKKLIKAANLPYVSLHSLRHYAATSLKDAGIEIKDAQDILGHASPLTTIRHYQHSNIENKKIALSKTIKNLQF